MVGSVKTRYTEIWIQERINTENGTIQEEHTSRDNFEKVLAKKNS